MTTYDHICEALHDLDCVREHMLDAMCSSPIGEITSKDFEALNALEQHLIDLRERYAPEYHPLTAAEIFGGVD